jgi:hypothetical protein
VLLNSEDVLLNSEESTACGSTPVRRFATSGSPSNSARRRAEEAVPCSRAATHMKRDERARAQPGEREGVLIEHDTCRGCRHSVRTQ